MNRGDPGFTFAGVLLLAALGAFVWRSAPLESARPPSEPVAGLERPDSERIPARLWQDPLGAVLRHRLGGLEARLAARRESLRSDVVRRLCEPSGARLTVLAVMVSPGAYSELEERRRRRRYAVLSGLGDSGFVPRDAEGLGVFPVPAEGTGEGPSRVAGEIRSAAQDACGAERPLGKVAASALPGTFSMPITLGGRGPGGGRDDAPSPEAGFFDVPYEWYDFEDPQRGGGATGDGPGDQDESVLVLWLDESRFTEEPFRRFRDLILELLPDRAEQRRQVNWVVLGPARSGTLRRFVADQCSDSVRWLREDSGLAGLHILSPVATVSDGDLGRHRPAGECPWDPKDGSDSLLGSSFARPCDEGAGTCLRFLRTIRSDDVLIAELKRELGRRGLRGGDDVVVLSEWDTYFGRFLPRAFAQAPGGENPLQVEGPAPRLNLLRYTYERGIDGITAGVEPLAPEKVPAGQGGFFDVLAPSEATAVRRPEGTGQFDYLRRLADSILERDRQLRLEKGRGVRAVAILGSDVYDKLLILRALRHRLPGTVWVTTDLDAHFLHPAEFPWTRNLVVAATFGLTPPEGLRSSSPPFRDSYQTAVYLATRMAVDPVSAQGFVGPRGDGREPPPPRFGPYPGQDAMNAAIPGRLFEVGRRGAVPLGTSPPSPAGERGGTVATVAARASRSPATPYFLGVGLIGLLGLFTLQQTRPRSGRALLTLGGLLVSALLLALLAVWQAPTGEPVSLGNGASIWPTELVRLGGIFLALTFFWGGYHRLKANWHLLDQRYFGGSGEPADSGLTLGEAISAIREYAAQKKARGWALGAILLLALSIAAMRSLNAVSGPLLEKLGLLAVGWPLLIGAWWLLRSGKILRDVQAPPLKGWASETEERTAAGLWRAYGVYGSLQQRVLRSVYSLLLYLAFASVVFSLLGSPSPPCRGAVACATDGLLLGVSVLLMLLLLFFVVDATRLCILWIQKLQAPGLQWHEPTGDELEGKPRLPATHATYWLQIHLIGERTTEVGRLLYYPVVVILLLLLARTTYFDDWGFPQAVAVIVGANFLIAVIAAARLNAAAQRARDAILDRLQRESLEIRSVGTAQPAVATPAELRELITQLSELRIGAYQRLWDQPIVRGTLLLLGGIGVTFVEYLPLGA